MNGITNELMAAQPQTAEKETPAQGWRRAEDALLGGVYPLNIVPDPAQVKKYRIRQGHQ